jgi:AraC-like DNA-binding protein
MTNIFYVGCDATHTNDFIFDIPLGHDCWLLIITQTPALFWVNGEIKEYPAHSAILYHPHQKIYYRACAEKYINDWIRFDSTESYVTETTLPLGTPFSLDDPEYCHKIFQLLGTEHSFNKDYKESSVDYLLRTLFNKLLESCFHTGITPQYYNLLTLRTAIHNNPSNNWTVPNMANFIHISQGYLQTIYKNTFGISCMDDVIDSRIRLAKEYLLHRNSTIAEVAILSGYNNVEHFCRQFKQITGYTPGKFNNHAINSSAELPPSSQ